MARQTAAQRKAEATEAPVEGATPAPAEEVPDGVLVLKIRDEDGNIRTAVQPIGSVEVTEVQTLLELGLAGFREQIGLGQPAR